MADGTRAYLGSGWKFPPQLDQWGRIRLVLEEEDVEEAIRVILSTRCGERQMRPEFGSHLWRLQFAPTNRHTATTASRLVREALERWEPRIEIVSVTCVPDPADGARLLIDIQYKIRSENAEYNLVYPFYVIPGGD